MDSIMGKESPRWTTSIWDTSRRPTQVLPHGDHQRNQLGLTTGDQREMEKGAELTANTAQALENGIPAHISA